MQLVHLVLQVFYWYEGHCIALCRWWAYKGRSIWSLYVALAFIIIPVLMSIGQLLHA